MDYAGTILTECKHESEPGFTPGQECKLYKCLDRANELLHQVCARLVEIRPKTVGLILSDATEVWMRGSRDRITYERICIWMCFDLLLKHRCIRQVVFPDLRTHVPGLAYAINAMWWLEDIECDYMRYDGERNTWRCLNRICYRRMSGETSRQQWGSGEYGEEPSAATLYPLRRVRQVVDLRYGIFAPSLRGITADTLKLTNVPYRPEELEGNIWLRELSIEPCCIHHMRVRGLVLALPTMINLRRFSFAGISACSDLLDVCRVLARLPHLECADFASTALYEDYDENIYAALLLFKESSVRLCLFVDTMFSVERAVVSLFGYAIDSATATASRGVAQDGEGPATADMYVNPEVPAVYAVAGAGGTTLECTVRYRFKIPSSGFELDLKVNFHDEYIACEPETVCGWTGLLTHLAIHSNVAGRCVIAQLADAIAEGCSLVKLEIFSDPLCVRQVLPREDAARRRRETTLEWDRDNEVQMQTVRMLRVLERNQSIRVLHMDMVVGDDYAVTDESVARLLRLNSTLERLSCVAVMDGSCRMRAVADALTNVNHRLYSLEMENITGTPGSNFEDVTRIWAALDRNSYHHVNRGLQFLDAWDCGGSDKGAVFRPEVVEGARNLCYVHPERMIMAGADSATLKRARAFVKCNFFVITGVVRSAIRADKTHECSLAWLGDDCIAYLCSFLRVQDILKG